MENCKLSNSHRFRPTFSCRSFDVYQRPAVDVLCCKLLGSVNIMVKSALRNIFIFIGKIIGPIRTRNICDVHWRTLALKSLRGGSLSIHYFFFYLHPAAQLFLGHPWRCGLSIWLSLLAKFNTHFWVYVIFFFHEKTDKTREYSKWYENGRRRLPDAQRLRVKSHGYIAPQEITTTHVSWAWWIILLHFRTFWGQFKISHTFLYITSPIAWATYGLDEFASWNQCCQTTSQQLPFFSLISLLYIAITGVRCVFVYGAWRWTLMAISLSAMTGFHEQRWDHSKMTFSAREQRKISYLSWLKVQHISLNQHEEKRRMNFQDSESLSRFSNDIN